MKMNYLYKTRIYLIKNCLKNTQIWLKLHFICFGADCFCLKCVSEMEDHRVLQYDMTYAT